MMFGLAGGGVQPLLVCQEFLFHRRESLRQAERWFARQEPLKLSHQTDAGQWRGSHKHPNVSQSFGLVFAELQRNRKMRVEQAEGFFEHANRGRFGPPQFLDPQLTGIPKSASRRKFPQKVVQ